MDRAVLAEILKDACRAPSADNTQPWKFIVQGNRIHILNAADQTESIFNYRQQVNHTSLGAAIENLLQSARAHGFATELAFFPEPAEPFLVAAVSLSEGNTSGTLLAAKINARSSNRKRYQDKPIPSQILQELSALPKSGEGRLSFVTGEEVSSTAHIVSAGEKLVLENRSIHDFLFSHVTWSKGEDARKHGFFIDTFEFAPAQRAIFQLFRNWDILKFFIPLGFSNFVARDMAKVYATSAAFGALIMQGKSREDYVCAGMLFERLWLMATTQSLALQPTTGLCFFAQPVLDGVSYDLGASSVALVQERYDKLKEVFGVQEGEETIALVFRLGYADSPSASTTRFEPDIEFED